MLRMGIALATVVAFLGSVTTAQAGYPTANLRTVELAGTIAIEGTPSAQTPVRFTARLIADTAGVPLQRGGRAAITHGRVYVNTIGTVVSACLSEASVRLAGTFSTGTRDSAKARGDVLRIGPRRRLALDLNVFVDASLRGSVGPVCAAGAEAASLQLRGTLGPGALAPVQLSASAPVTLQDGRRVAMRVIATATVKRYLRPA